MTGLRLYDYAASANCYKVRLLVAQLGLEVERVPVDIFAGESLGDAYGRVNPARTVPVLETHDGRSCPSRCGASSGRGPSWTGSCGRPSAARRSCAGSSTSRRT